MEQLKTVAMVVVVLGAMLGGLVALNKWSNHRQETHCVQAGGEFYRSADAGHSLCKLPTRPLDK